MICLNCGKTVNARHWYRTSGQPRCWDRYWTKAREWELMKHWEQGLSDEEIGARMGKTANAVELKRKRMGLVNGRAPRSRYTAQQAARLLGVKCSKTITRWCRLGWVAGKQGYHQGPHRVWLISEEAIRAFLANPDHWQDWHPERITDPLLRRWALELRGGERYLTLGQAAERFCVEPKTVRQWIRKGWLPAVRMGTRGNHLVRAADVERLAPTYVWGNGLNGATA